MCGIAAVFALKGSCDCLSHARAMTQVIRHRGPDDEGYAAFPGDSSVIVLGGPDTPQEAYRSSYLYAPDERPTEEKPRGAYAALGHRRLSIIDLSPSGHQPMCSSDGRYWITYNGEVYNYLELRRQLEAEGFAFRSQSDTEVILNAYKRWGNACLSVFNGMFAFVIVDGLQRKLFAARDRFGVKPLYYWFSPAGFVAFASEIKQFAHLPGWRPQVNGQRAYEFLNWGLTDHTSETLFADVRQLRGGEMVECSLDVLGTHVPITRWYDLQSRSFAGVFDDATEQFRGLLEDAVRLRLRADVPVGSCLSGGLDSSSIVCLANQLLRTHSASYTQETFSACSRVPRFDERFYIEQVVAKTGVRAHYTYPDLEGLFEASTLITQHQDEPFGSTSLYAQWSVFQLARRNGVKVMLDGQGADEQLGGYANFLAYRLYDLFKALHWRTWVEEMVATRRLHPDLDPVALTADHVLPQLIRQPLRRLIGKSVVMPDWLNLSKLGAEKHDPFRTEHGKGDDTVNQNAYLQIMKTNLPMLLRYEDRNSMAHSVESRTPFLDYRLVEFVQGLPSAFKVSRGVTKKVLRDGLKGVLPEGVRTRVDKIAFATPEENWVRDDRPQQFVRAVEDAIEQSQGIVRPSAVALANAVISGKRPFDFAIWRVVNFGMWMQTSQARVGAGS